MRKSLSLAVLVALLLGGVCPPARARSATPAQADPYVARLRGFEEFVDAGVQLHPKDAKLRELLGDFLARKGRPGEAAESYRRAYNIDPALGKGLPADEYAARRLRAAAEQQKKN